MLNISKEQKLLSNFIYRWRDLSKEISRKWRGGDICHIQRKYRFGKAVWAGVKITRAENVKVGSSMFEEESQLPTLERCVILVLLSSIVKARAWKRSSWCNPWRFNAPSDSRADRGKHESKNRKDEFLFFGSAVDGKKSKDGTESEEIWIYACTVSTWAAR